MKMFGSEYLRDVVRDHTLTLLPEPGSAQRSKFMFTSAAPASNKDIVDDYDASATTVDEAEIDEISDVAPPLHLAEAVPTTSPRAPTPPPTAGLSSLGNAIEGPAASPREIPEHLQPTKSITNNPSLVSSEIPQFPLPTPSPVLVSPPILDSCEAAMLDQAAVVLRPAFDVSSQISQTIAPHQLVNSPMTTQVLQLAPTPPAPGPPQAATRQFSPIALTGPAAVSSTFKTREPGVTSQSRRNSIEGAPDVILTLGGSGYELSGQPDISVALHTATAAPTTPLDDLVIPSSQQSLEGVLTIPPGTDAIISKGSGMSRFAPRVIPEFNHNKSDFPSWLHERKRLDAVLKVEAGDLWKKLIGLWLQQERRLAFGLNDGIVSRTLFQLYCCIVLTPFL